MLCSVGNKSVRLLWNFVKYVFRVCDCVKLSEGWYGYDKKGETVVISECIRKTNVGISVRPILLHGFTSVELTWWWEIVLVRIFEKGCREKSARWGVWEFGNIKFLTIRILLWLRCCEYWKVSVWGEVGGKPKLRINAEQKCEVRVAVWGVRELWNVELLTIWFCCWCNISIEMWDFQAWKNSGGCMGVLLMGIMK